jgi:hypothetical protein
VHVVKNLLLIMNFVNGDDKALLVVLPAKTLWSRVEHHGGALSKWLISLTQISHFIVVIQTRSVFLGEEPLQLRGFFK